MSHKQNDLGRDPIGPLLMRLALPTICAQVVNLLYSIVDRIYIGQLPDTAALTGMGVTFPVITLISAFAALIGMGGAPRASIAMGAGEHDKAERTLGSCTGALWILALVLTGAFLLWQEPLLMLFGASENTLPYAMDYLNIYVLGTIFVMTALGLNGFITAQGKSSVAMKTVLIGAGLNVVLDPVFIFVFGMGVRGAAVATVISQAVSALWVVRFLASPKSELRLRREHLKPRKELLLPAIALGAAPFVMQATESLLTITFNRSLLTYGGDLAVGAMTILVSVAQMIQMPLFGLAQGAQPILSYNYGAGRVDRMKQVVRYNILIAAVYAAAVWLLVMLSPELIVRMFNRNPELVQLASWALRIYLAAGFVMAFQTGFQQSFVALGEAKISLFLALERKVILLIPLILILPQFMEDQLFAVFFAEPVADFLAAATTTVLFLLRFRQITRKMEQNEPE
ncbi:MATE family efflux transporter [Butyricicoccus sp. Marseille-Q5471]|uniref:MATE family efflux transporter n=1 Tax=Butyricicoccus sp. Marseille-Q5471 TaxID=3039493 RepID=UPI0024BCDD4E|nr:MATE family efflux transporter [Butyricicoccus sp. Marseille-Q5471]